ncbi:MAG: RNA polymerase I-specific transcription initiation factor RRN3 family protein [Holosporaceae bacterium]|nr:RNA polymerase I-specific transcription initiation factor RRN3 family protein [Holosporaceae bacterium]
MSDGDRGDSCDESDGDAAYFARQTDATDLQFLYKYSLIEFVKFEKFA